MTTATPTMTLRAARALFTWKKTRSSCYRCGGSGRYGHYGVCYRCGGARVDPKHTDKVRVWADGVTDEQKAEAIRLDTESKTRARETRQARAEAKRVQKATDNLANVYAQYPGIEDAFKSDNSFIQDVKARAAKWGNVSPKQAAAVIKAAQRDAERKAQRDAEAATAKPVVEGRVVVTGEVLTVKWQDSDYGGSLKMLVKDDRGFKVWGTVPSDLKSRWDTSGCAAQKGSRVTFTATVQQSRDDRTFGFYKRPTKASLLAA